MPCIILQVYSIFHILFLPKLSIRNGSNEENPWAPNLDHHDLRKNESMVNEVKIVVEVGVC